MGLGIFGEFGGTVEEGSFDYSNFEYKKVQARTKEELIDKLIRYEKMGWQVPVFAVNQRGTGSISGDGWYQWIRKPISKTVQRIGFVGMVMFVLFNIYVIGRYML